MQFRYYKTFNGLSRLRRLSLISFFLLMLLCLSPRGSAQEPFYSGKTIRIIVGTGAGGGYDLYSRAVARHFDKHMSGNPVVIVDRSRRLDRQQSSL